VGKPKIDVHEERQKKKKRKTSKKPKLNKQI
jgi:hypothetical protein